MNVQNSGVGSKDALAALIGVKMAGTNNKEFKNLLDKMMEMMDEFPELVKPASPKPTAPPEGQAETKPDDATAEAAASQMVQPPPEAQQNAEKADGGHGSEGGTSQVHQADRTQGFSAQEVLELLDTIKQTAQIQSFEVLAEVAETEEEMDFLALMEQVLDAGDDAAAQDRLGMMLGQATQELEAIADQNAGEDGSKVPLAELPAESGEEMPAAEIEQPENVELPEFGGGEQPEEPEADNSAAVKLPEEQLPEARVQSEPDRPVLEQRPLSELPERDRVVLEMRPTSGRPAEREKDPVAEVAVVQDKPEPEPPRIQTVQEPEQPQRPSQPMDQMEQIRVEMTQNLEQQKMEFRMQLQPEELGKVNVKMILEDGRLAVEIIAASPKAAEILARQAEGLMQSLRMQQFDVQHINVVTESQTAEGFMDGAFNMLNSQTGDGQDSAGKPGRGGNAAGGTEQETDPAQGEIQSPDTLLDYKV